MATPGSLCRMMLLSLLYTSTEAQSVDAFFLPDTNVRSIDASVVEYKTLEFSETVVTYVVNCPTAQNSHNDACRSESNYPATVWHTYGSLYEGSKTGQIDDSKTYWRCNLATGAPAYTGGPLCVKSITDSAGRPTATTTRIDPCFIQSHSVAMVITAGADLVPKEHYLGNYLTVGVPQLLSAWSENLVEIGCSSTTQASTSKPAQTTSHAITSSTGEPSAVTGSSTGAGNVSEPSSGTLTASSGTLTASSSTSAASTTPVGTGASGSVMSPGISMLMIIGSIVYCLSVW